MHNLRCVLHTIYLNAKNQLFLNKKKINLAGPQKPHYEMVHHILFQCEGHKDTLPLTKSASCSQGDLLGEYKLNISN